MKVLAKLKTWQLVLALFVVIGGTTLFMVLASGSLFANPKAEISQEYRCRDDCNGVYIDITSEEYEKLIGQKKSFLVFVDQGGCKTADRLKSFVNDWAVKKGIRVHKIMFEDMKETSLYDSVKYYPSVAVVSDGKVIGYLRADADEDSDVYNKPEAYEVWVEKYLKNT